MDSVIYRGSTRPGNAGPHARDSEKCRQTFKNDADPYVSPRSAQFKCVLVIYSPTGEEFVYEGELKGTISSKPSGLMGFGYDPIFVPDGETKTLADLGPGLQNSKISSSSCSRKVFSLFKK